MKKNIFILPVFIFLLILLVFFYLLSIERNPSEVPSALINKEAPNFQTKNLMDENIFISSREFENQIVIVNFFATWCKPCRQEHEFIKKLSDAKKAKIIGINYKDNEEKTKTWLKELGNPYSVVAIDKKGKIGINWGVYGIPETFIIDPDGIIKYRHVGPVNKFIYKKIIAIINEINE
jgi:cytochrome c biogenesis protein CcmG, thiol:disulfide interchange protein DsbE